MAAMENAYLSLSTGWEMAQMQIWLENVVAAITFTAVAYNTAASIF